jgi:hypothetical protein
VLALHELPSEWHTGGRLTERETEDASVWGGNPARVRAKGRSTPILPLPGIRDSTVGDGVATIVNVVLPDIDSVADARYTLQTQRKQCVNFLRVFWGTYTK